MTETSFLRSRTRSWSARATLLSAALVALSCGEQTKVKECTALVTVINKGVDEVQRGARSTPDAGTEAKSLRTLADTLDQIAGEAGKVELTHGELQKLAKDYQTMTGEIATAARELATAFEKVDEDGMRSAQAKMEKAVQQEEPLVESINKFCRTP